MTSIPPILMVSVRADRSGGPRYLENLLEEFKGERIFLAIPANESLSDRLSQMAVKTVTIPSRTWSPVALFSMLQLIRKENIRIVHSHGRGAGLYSRILRLAGVRVVHQFHGLHDGRGIRGMVGHALERVLRLATDCQICVSADEQSIAAKRNLLGPRALVVLSGVRCTHTQAQRTPIGNLIRLCALTRMDAVKNIPTLIRLIERWSSQHPGRPWTLSLGGLTESDRKVLESDVGPFVKDPRINFPGIIGNTGPFLAMHDILLSSSTREGLPLSALEALAEGTLCLLSNVPGHETILRSGAAMGFSLEQPETFSIALERLIDSEETQNQIRRTGTNLVRTSHSASKMAGEIKSVYNRLIQNKEFIDEQ